MDYLSNKHFSSLFQFEIETQVFQTINVFK